MFTFMHNETENSPELYLINTGTFKLDYNLQPQYLLNSETISLYS